jgi:hypothetical protein
MTHFFDRRAAIRMLAGFFALPLAAWLKGGLELRSGWVMRKTDG